MQSTVRESTALIWAAIRGHSGVVKMLSEREDVKPNRANTGSGQTPLLWAIWKGHEEAVKILLEREDLSPNQAPGMARNHSCGRLRMGVRGL